MLQMQVTELSIKKDLSIFLPDSAFHLNMKSYLFRLIVTYWIAWWWNRKGSGNSVMPDGKWNYSKKPQKHWLLSCFALLKQEFSLNYWQQEIIIENNYWNWKYSFKAKTLKFNNSNLFDGIFASTKVKVNFFFFFSRNLSFFIQLNFYSV